MGDLKVQKALSHLGYGSRRRCEEIIADGRVFLDGELIRLGDRIEEEDIPRLKLDGKPVRAMPAKRYLVLNKPSGHVTTVSDPQGRPTVMDLIPDDCEEGAKRLFPVGRLDKDTTGLLLFTNDGNLSNRLLHPSSAVEKEYRARVAGSVTDAGLRTLRKGPVLDDGPTQPPRKVEVSAGTVTLVLKEGRKRQVRGMLAAVGLHCLELERVRFGNLTIEGLKRGTCRDLTGSELKGLKQLCADR